MSSVANLLDWYRARRNHQFAQLAVLWVGSGFALAVATWAGLAFGASLTTAVCTYLFIIVSSLLLYSHASRNEVALNLHNSLQRYRHLFDNCPIALFEIDTRILRKLFGEVRARGVTDFAAYLDDNPDFMHRAMAAHIIVDANQRGIDMFSSGDAENLLEWNSRIWGRNHEVYRRALVSRFRDDPVFQEKIKVEAVGGQLIDTIITLSRSEGLGDAGLSFIALVDVTKQVRANEELRLSEQRYRTLFEQAQHTQEMLAENEQRYRQLFEYAPVALAQLNAGNRSNLLQQLRDEGVTDLKAYFDRHPDLLRRIKEASTVENVNRRMVEMFGARDAGELLGKTHRFWRRGPETYLRGLESRLRGESIFQGEMEVDTLDGRLINVVVTLARPKELDAHGINFVGFVDVTDQVRATVMLQKLEAEFAHTARVSILGELSASIAHEINQPLTAIMANAEASQLWLNRSDPDIGKARQALQRVVEAATRSGEIVSRIRSMAAGLAPEYTEVSPNEIINEAIKFLNHQIKLSNVDVSLDLAPDLPSLNGDQVQLQQVAVNLIVNAIQAMDRANTERPAIMIRTTHGENETIRCSFEDGGPGIEGRHFDSLFKSFFTTKDTGMGMGLPVSRAIVEAHGGKVSADNESALGGAHFIVTLPGGPASK